MLSHWNVTLPFGTYDLLREAAPTWGSAGLTRKVNARTRVANRVSVLGFQEEAIIESYRKFEKAF